MFQGEHTSFVKMIHALRLCEEKSQVDFADKLKISRTHLCDIEKGRKLVSPQKALEYAKLLKHSASVFVQTALQDHVNQLKRPKFIVKLQAATWVPVAMYLV